MDFLLDACLVRGLGSAENRFLLVLVRVQRADRCRRSRRSPQGPGEPVQVRRALWNNLVNTKKAYILYSEQKGKRAVARPRVAAYGLVCKIAAPRVVAAVTQLTSS
jgi:hypothetical protein